MHVEGIQAKILEPVVTWVNTCIQVAPLLPEARGVCGAPLSLWASELRTNLNTTIFSPRNCRRSRSIAAHNGVRISRDPEAYVNGRNMHPQEHNALTDGTRGDPRGDARCEAPHSIPRQLRPPAHSPQPLPFRDLVHAVEVRGTICARPYPAEDRSREENLGRRRDPID